MDNEPFLVAGMECGKDIRARLGLDTTLCTNKHYDKARTSVAERMVQSIRNLQKTLVLQLEDSIQCKLPGGHSLRYWGVVHAAWLYSCYQRLSCPLLAESHPLPSSHRTSLPWKTGQLRGAGSKLASTSQAGNVASTLERTLLDMM